MKTLWAALAAVALMAGRVPAPALAGDAAGSATYIFVLADRAAGDVGQRAARVAARHGATLQKVYRHGLRGFALRTTEAAAQRIARQSADVAFVEKDTGVSVEERIVPLPAAAAGARASAQVTPWGVTRVGACARGSCNVPASVPNPRVWVLDTGIAPHLDLTIDWSRAFSSVGEGGVDHRGHGTHVAGTIGATGGNGLGVVGVNWNVSLLSAKFLGPSGGTTANAIKAVDYFTNLKLAQRLNIVACNNSWGGGGYSEALHSSIIRAAKAGILFVAAAGNSSANNDTGAYYPCNYNTTAGTSTETAAAYDGVISVASITSSGALSSFSSYGATTVDIGAPGSGVFSSVPVDTYASYNGTSMATPHVTGAIALYALYQGADSLVSLTNRVAGSRRLNIGNMLKGTSSTPPPTDLAGAKVTKGQFNSVNNQVSSATLTFSEAIDPASFTISDLVFRGPSGVLPVTGVTPVSGSGNQQFTVSFDPFSQAGNYNLQVGPGVQDVAGNLMDQNGNGVNGESTDIFSLAWSQQAQTVYSNTTDVTIKDLRTVSSSIQVGADLIVGDLNVRLNISHTYVSDLVIVVQAPWGSQYTLFNRRGGSGDHLVNTLFDDQAAAGIAQGVAPFTGSFRPEGPLSGVNGRNAKGTWTLFVSDRQTRDSGKLLDWTLEFTQQTQVASLAGRRLTPALLQTMVSIQSEDLPAGDVWRGGALLASPMPALPVVQAKVANPSLASIPMPVGKDSMPPPRLAMLAMLDRLVWSRMVSENVYSPRARVKLA